MEDSAFHVLLEGAEVGPYNRRTIVGMRIKNTLTSDHVVVGRDGTRMTVADLIEKRPPEEFNATRSGVFSLVRATYGAALMHRDRRGGLPIPRFTGEVEVRVQSDVLRLAGRFRQGFAWKEDRVKIPLHAIVHARVRGSLVDLWLRNGARAKLQRIVLEMFTPTVAGDLVEWLPDATPHPDESGAKEANGGGASQNGLWVAMGSVCFVVAVVLVVAVWPRVR